jgi:hypothetical protein
MLQIFLWVGGVSLFIMLALSPILYIAIGRKFDKLFKHVTLWFDPEIPGLSAWGRAINYACCIVLKNRTKNDKYFREVYNGYDFYGNSTLFQKILAWAFFIFGFSGGIFSIPWAIAQFFTH